MVKIEEIFTTSLRQASKQHTADTLGDRSEYIGASEIGHCPRKVILDKLNPAEQSLTSLLRFERGHMAEDIVAKVFQAAGYPFERQHENIIPCSVPFRAHTDFVFTANKSKIKSILEVKSCTIPSEPYGSWESQLYTQMGAIAEEYPDYAVKGSILAIDLTSGQVALFSGYVPNEIIYKSLITKAEDIWTEYQRLRQGESLDTTTVPDPLCGFCSHLVTCPRFEGADTPELIPFVEELQGMQTQFKQLKSQIDNKKSELLEIVEQNGTLHVGSTILSKHIQNRSNMDTEKLYKFLESNGLNIAEFQKPSTATWLDIKKAK